MFSNFCNLLSTLISVWQIVAEVDVAKAVKSEEWKGISALFNFEFLASGIRAWKSYGVGEGKMFPYDEVDRSSNRSSYYHASYVSHPTVKARAADGKGEAY